MNTQKLPETIAAIVVTYNRKLLLEQCIQSILRQTHPVSHIFIIDNASTDGSKQYFKEKRYLDHTAITYIELSENTGGAGGFYEGMKQAYQQGYDWLWLMDDDGYPADDCLEYQLHTQYLDIIGAVVVRPEDHNQLTWKFICYDKHGYFSPFKRISTQQDLKSQFGNEIYPRYALFFNAILISRKVISKVGFVNPDLFIRGDEFDYFLRCLKANISMATQIQAIYYHPFQPFQANELKFFYAFRNLFYNYTQHSSVTYQQPFYIFYLIYRFVEYLFKSPSHNFKYLIYVLKAVYLSTQGTLLPYHKNFK